VGFLPASDSKIAQKLVSLFGPIFSKRREENYQEKTWLQRLDLEVDRNWLEVFNQAFCESWNLW
jgi:hypothetical protein